MHAQRIQLNHQGPERHLVTGLVNVLGHVAQDVLQPRAGLLEHVYAVVPKQPVRPAVEPARDGDNLGRLRSAEEGPHPLSVAGLHALHSPAKPTQIPKAHRQSLTRHSRWPAWASRPELLGGYVSVRPGRQVRAASNMVR